MMRLAYPSLLALLAALALVLTCQHTQARSFRDILQIPTPAALPRGAERVEPIQRLDRQLVLRGVNEILTAWNTGSLQAVLAEEFIDAQKLADTVVNTVPQDAVLSLLSMRSYTVLRQYRTQQTDDGDWRISRVAVSVQLQLTFNDSQTGYQRLPSTSEFILEIREPI